MAVSAGTPIELVQGVYSTLPANAALGRKRLGRPLTLAEKILIAPGLMFSNSNRFEHFIRLNCGQPFNPEIERSLKRLGQLCVELRHKN